jgi:hypothetical protein
METYPTQKLAAPNRQQAFYPGKDLEIRLICQEKKRVIFSIKLIY